MSFHFNLSSSSEDEGGGAVAVGDGDGDEEEEEREQFRNILNWQLERHRKHPDGTESTGQKSGDLGRSEVQADDSERADRDCSGDDSDSLSGSDVEWEDCSMDQPETVTAGPAAASASSLPTSMVSSSTATGSSLKLPEGGITIDFSPDEKKGGGDTDTAGRKKRRRVATRKKLTNVSPDVALLVLNVHRAHLLALTSRCVHISDELCSPLVLNAALSVVPERLHGYQVPQGSNPTYEAVRDFVVWFFDLVNHVHDRRRAIAAGNIAAGAPRSNRATRAGRGRRRSRSRSGRRTGSVGTSSTCSIGPPVADNTNLASEGGTNLADHIMRLLFYISPSHDDDPQYLMDGGMCTDGQGVIISPRDKTMLLVVMGRCMGWRVRYVTAFQPVERELTVDHPLLQSGGGAISPSDRGRIGNFFRTMVNVSQRLSLKEWSSLTSSTSSGISDIAKCEDTNGKKSESRRKRRNVSKESKRIEVDTEPDGTCIHADDEQFDVSQAHARGNASTGKTMSTPTVMKQSVSADACADDGSEKGGDVLSWVEILCEREENRRKCPATATNASVASASAGRVSSPMQPSTSTAPSTQWAHVDVNQELFDQPQRVETIMSRKDYRSKSSRQSHRRDKVLVSYVLAVEHRCGVDNRCQHDREADEGDGTHCGRQVRLTDVTPRYANHWSQTLRLRGMTGKQLAKSGGKCDDDWWGETLRRINRSFKAALRKHTLSTGGVNQPQNSRGCILAKPMPKGTRDDAIVLDSSDDQDCGHRYDMSEDEDEDDVKTEQKELHEHSINEAIPTSKAAFKNHPVYVVPSVLNAGEVLCPDAGARVCGMFKGELVYRRKEVSEAMPPKKWLYNGRKVREQELSKPAKSVKARKKPASNTFKALTSYMGEDAGVEDEEDSDGMQRLYGRWQTEPWAPSPVAPHEDIPVNEYKNVEKALINPGLVHLEEYRISLVAKKLGIPYAPCLLGFEGHGGNRTPKIRGIVVHEHNVELLREAHAEWESQALEQEFAKRQKEIYMRWKKLIVGVMTKARLDEEYGETKLQK